MENIEALTDVLAASHRLGRIAAREKGSTTPVAQWRALSTLEEHGPLRLGTLAAACGVTQPGMTRLVDMMTAAGLVARAKDPGDARAVVLEVTDAGRAARRAWIDTVREALAPRFADLSDDEWRAVQTTAALLRARSTDLADGAA